MRNLLVWLEKWIAIGQLVPVLFRVFRSPGKVDRWNLTHVSFLPLQGIVETTKPLDREDIASFHITIIAEDQGKPSRNSTAVLVVNVLDANDNSPRLDTIMANVTEEQPKGQYVTRVVAMDSDQGRNGEVEYNLTIRGLQSLNIDSKTGVITTKVKFDHEEQRIHTFIVIATDNGKITGGFNTVRRLWEVLFENLGFPTAFTIAPLPLLQTLRRDLTPPCFHNLPLPNKVFATTFTVSLPLPFPLISW